MRLFRALVKRFSAAREISDPTSSPARGSDRAALFRKETRPDTLPTRPVRPLRSSGLVATICNPKPRCYIIRQADWWPWEWGLCEAGTEGIGQADVPLNCFLKTQGEFVKLDSFFRKKFEV